MTDIKLIHELDDTLNQRIIIIKNQEKNPLDIITSEDKRVSAYHAQYLKKYFDFAYLDDEELQRVKEKIVYTDGIVVSNILYYLLKRYDNIIFMETTEDGKDKRYGILNLPDEMSEMQYAELKELFPYFENFSSILVQGGLKSDGYVVTDTEFAKEVKGEKMEEIDYYLKTLIKKVEEKHM